jgi:hypothetical protein
MDALATLLTPTMVQASRSLEVRSASRDEFEKSGSDLQDRERFAGSVELNSELRRSINGRRGTILHDRISTRIPNLLHPLGAVVAHPRQNHRQRPRPDVPRHGTKQSVRGRVDGFESGFVILAGGSPAHCRTHGFRCQRECAPGAVTTMTRTDAQGLGMLLKLCESQRMSRNPCSLHPRPDLAKRLPVRECTGLRESVSVELDFEGLFLADSLL